MTSTRPSRLEIDITGIEPSGTIEWNPRKERYEMRSPERSEEEMQFSYDIPPLMAPTRAMNKKSQAKIPVPAIILRDSLKLASHCNQTIEYETKNIGKSAFSDFLSPAMSDPLKAIQYIYTKGLPGRFRGFEDVINPLHYVNAALNLVCVTGELITKTAAAFLTKPISACTEIIKDKNRSNTARFLAGVGWVLSTPLWLLSQVLFAAGNVLSYTRKIVDGFSNLVSSGIAKIADIFIKKKNHTY